MSTSLPLPGDLQARLDRILARPCLRRAPRLREEIAALAADACERPSPPSLSGAQRGLPAQLQRAPETGPKPTITGYLEAHIGEVVTAEQVAAATGETLTTARVFLREAGDRDWADQVPGGWKIA